MNDKYKAVNCPICDKSLENTDVVVCPDCGAPYHRKCYAKEGQCIFPELHATGNDWKPTKAELDLNNEVATFPKDKLENTSNTCTRCGTVNPSTGVFCQICGNKLAENSQPKINKPDNNDDDNLPKDKFEPSENYSPPHNIPLNPIANPLGGLAPNDTIDGICVKDIAVFVGRSSHYYLPKFKELSQKKGPNINFAAFFFTGGFYLYRKMFLLGILFCFFDVIFSIPSTILMYEQMTTQMITGSQLIHQNQAIYDLNQLCSYLVLALRFVCGFCANSLYKSYVFKKINETKKLNLKEADYFKTLAKEGSVALGLIRFVLGCYLTINFLFIVMVLMS